MRGLELFYLFSCLLGHLLYFFEYHLEPFQRDCTYFLLSHYVFLALHVWIEKPRWQLIPAYVVSLLDIPCVFTDFLFPIYGFLFIPLIITAIAFSLLLPVPWFPPPFKLPVGTVTISFEVTYDQRVSWTEDRRVQVKRKLRAKVWYPSGIYVGRKTPYLLDPQDYIHLTKSDYVFHPFLASHFKLAKTSSLYGAPVATEFPEGKPGWPVVIFSPGQLMLPDFYSHTCESLATKGYVVFAIYHDDNNKEYPGPYKQRMQEIKALAKLIRTWNESPTNASTALYKVLYYKLHESNQDENLFRHKFDLRHGVGLFGHSFGATCSLTLTEKKRREGKIDKAKGANPNNVPFSCVALLDTWMFPFPHADSRELRYVTMFVNSDLWLSKPEDQDKLRTFYTAKSKGVYAITMKGTSHFNFTDLPFVISSPLYGQLLPNKILHEPESGRILMLGPTDAKVAAENINQALTDFFYYHLAKPVDKPILPVELPRSNLYSVQKFPVKSI